jgi:hypothetical protein
MEETRLQALGCELESESLDIPVWPDVDDLSQPMVGEDLTGVAYPDASAALTGRRRRGWRAD